MDSHVKKFYRQFSDETPDGRFHRVIALHEAPDIEWSVLHKQFPMICKGWYELTLLDADDRIEFIRDYWLAKLPYRPQLSEFLTRFFASLDDVGIYIYQYKFDDPYEVDIVYSLKDNAGFFRGSVPATEALIEDAKAALPEFLLPADYTAFLQIHNGFCKTTDCTGLIKAEFLASRYKAFQEAFGQRNDLFVTIGGVSIDPKKLLPFYESFGLPFYQCFWADWYPEQEMGNVYFSGNNATISDLSEAESMAFPSFLDWLMFYLERIE
jgi:hypothetical protein